MAAPGREGQAFDNTPKVQAEEEDEDNLKQQRQELTDSSAVQHARSAEATDSDFCSSARSKRPHVPYSQREIYEKKVVPRPMARPPTAQASNRRNATGATTTATDSGGSTLARQPAASPAYSHSNSRTTASPAIRTAASPAASANPGTATSGAGRSTSVGRHRATTPLHGTSATPRGASGTSATPRESAGEAARTPPTAGGALRTIHEKPLSLASRPSVDLHQQYQQITPVTARAPVSARGHGFTSPGLRTFGPAFARTPSPGPFRNPSPGPGYTTANDANPMSARQGRAQSASRPQRPSQPQTQPPVPSKPSPTKPSPAKPSYSPHGTPPALTSGKGHGSPPKPSVSPPQQLPAWNPSTSKAPSPPPPSLSRPITSGGSAGRVPRKTQDASGGGSVASAAAAVSTTPTYKISASPAAAMAAAAASAAARGLIAGVDQAGSDGDGGPEAAAMVAAAKAIAAGGCARTPSLSASSTNDCAALRDAESEGARSAEPAGEAKSLPCGVDTAGRGSATAATTKPYEKPTAATDGGASEAAESLGLIDLDGSDSASLCGSKVPHAGVPAKGALLAPAPSCADVSEVFGTPAATGRERAIAEAETKAAEVAAESAARHCGCVVM